MKIHLYAYQDEFGARRRGALRGSLSALLLAMVFFLIAVEPAGAVSSGVNLFRSSEQLKTRLAIFPKWTGVLDRISIERSMETAPCLKSAYERCHLAAWRGFLRGLQGAAPMEQLRAVNAYGNRTRYLEDIVNYGVQDYWATPRQFFYRKGDCEDYAIAKYISLRRLGWPAGRMRIVVLQDDNLRVAHAVLVVYMNGTAYVLDNQIKAVVDHRRIYHYRPIYSVNERNWWYHRRIVR